MRIMRSILVATIASLIVLPIAAIPNSEVRAQVDPNTDRMTDFDNLFFQNSKRAGLNVASLCFAKKRPVQAQKTLSYGFMSSEQATSLDRFFKRFAYDSSCNLTRHVESDVPSVPVIGGLAEFFLLQKYTSDDIESLDERAQPDWQTGLMKPRNSNEFFGQCVVQANRSEVYKLVNTIPDTDSEGDVFKGIVPSLVPCVADGQEVSFDKTSLRAILAFSLYRAVSQHQKMKGPAK